MNNIKSYMKNIERLLKKLQKTEKNNIKQAATAIANTIQNNGWLYVFGTGHSHMVAEEFFYRAGGLVRVYPIFDSALMLHEGAVNSTSLERQTGYANKLLTQTPLKSGDVIIIASNSGRNAVPIEMAIEAKKRGATVIALTSLKHSKSTESRHESGKKLYELADIIIDNGGEIGDACISAGSGKVAPTSTVINSIVVNAIVAEVAALSDKAEFFMSSNTDEGEKRNLSYIEKYRKLIPFL